jgi:trk/ktr system potassium uptake protein
MKTVIVGCGRVGAEIAEHLDRSGHEVLVIDVQTGAFERLPESFGGNAIRADGTDEEALRRAGAEDADLFLALTEGDNRNVMATQLAAEVLGARQVVAKVNDPVRANAYAELGLATLCRTNLMEDAINDFVGLPRLHDPGVIAPRGVHPGGDHHIQAGDAAAAEQPPLAPPAVNDRPVPAAGREA